MKKFVFALMLLAPVAVVVGCGGVDEEPPPTETPELTAEEQANMEAQIQKSMEQQRINK